MTTAKLSRSHVRKSSQTLKTTLKTHTARQENICDCLTQTVRTARPRATQQEESPNLAAHYASIAAAGNSTADLPLVSRACDRFATMKLNAVIAAATMRPPSAI